MESLERQDNLILIGVCTYKRPGMLSTLLAASAKLRPPQGLQLALLIVDNDPEGTARAAVENARQTSPIPVYYRIERKRGISNARNRVLEEAILLDASYLAFIDDDEIMPPHWLAELYRVLCETGADAAGGPSYWDLQPDAPAWQHALPTSPRYEALYGARAKHKLWLYPSTNNVLMRASIYREFQTRFDVRFGMTGGEDTDFFRRAKEAGARYAFAKSAAVFETVPPSRLTLGWRFRRWAGIARGNVRMHRLQYGEKSAWQHYLPRSLPKFVTGPLLLLVALVTGPETMLRGLKHIGGAVGIVQELLRRKSAEYDKIHGDYCPASGLPPRLPHARTAIRRQTKSF
jgi:glycosyltransferase involved in cell wall biosynthesis